MTAEENTSIEVGHANTGPTSPPTLGETQPSIDADTDFDPLPDSDDRTFRAVYTGSETDTEVEVDVVETVPASESPFKYGHAVIDRPDWDDPKNVTMDELRMVINNDSDE